MAAPRPDPASFQEALPLAAFLDQVHGQVGLGVRERLAAERLLREWGAVQRERELRAALVSLLASDKESWQQIARLWDAHFPPKPEPPEPEPDRERMLRLARVAGAGGGRAKRPPSRVAGAVAVGLVAGLLLAVGVETFRSRAEAPLAPAGIVESGTTEVVDSTEGLTFRVVSLGETVSTRHFSPPPVGLGLLASLGVAIFLLLLFGLHLRALPEAVASQRKREMEHDRKEGDAQRVDLEHRRAASGAPLELSYRVDRFPAVSQQAIVDSAQPLGRLYREQRSDELDVDVTLDHTVRRGGRFSPAFLPRQIRHEVLILIDLEEGDHPWLGSFRRLVAAWAAQGVRVRLVEIEGDYTFQEVDPQQPDEEVWALETLTLGELIRHTEGLPLLLFSRQLDPATRVGESAWSAALPAWPQRAWLDPTPLPLAELRPSHRAAIAAFEAVGLRRFPLTDAGVVSLAGHLAGGDETAEDEAPLAPLPERRPAGSGEVRAEALRLWALAAALVPDPTWDQLEAIRRHFPEIHDALPDAREVQRLLQWIARELGSPRRDLSKGRGLDIPRNLEHVWLQEQRALDKALPQEERFEIRARRLLLQQLAPTRPEDPLDAAFWDFKRANHLAVLEPHRARALLEAFLKGPLAREGAPIIAAELKRQDEAGGTEAWSLEDREALRAGIDQAAALERPLRLRELGLTRVDGGGRHVLLAAAASLLLPLALWLLAPSISEPFAVEVTSRSPTNVLSLLEDVKVRKLRGVIEMIPLDGGEFLMGSKTGDPDERPVREVTIPAFELAKTEVTVGQYRLCVESNEAKACKVPETPYESCNWKYDDREEHPMNCVSWEEARAFAAWAGGRLPSEAEWEYAARSGGQKREYPWGDQEADCSRAVIASSDGGGCGEERTWEVCSKQAGNTDQGLCDMAGNVWEWVEDDWKEDYVGAPGDESPRTIDSASYRVIRGGSWGYEPRLARAAYRSWGPPSFRFDYLGFRVARSPSEPLALEPSNPRQEEARPE